MKNWSFEQDAAGRGVIKHNAHPRFSAYWTSGAAEEAAPLELFWSVASSNEDDNLHFYGLQWIDTQPDSITFERLMQEAAKAIDEWIESRL